MTELRCPRGHFRISGRYLTACPACPFCSRRLVGPERVEQATAAPGEKRDAPFVEGGQGPGGDARRRWFRR